MLVSKAMVDGVDGGAGRYSAQQRQRLYRVGIREFFRLDAAPGPRIDDDGRLRRLHLRPRGGAAVHASTRSSTSTRAAASTPACRSTTSSSASNSHPPLSDGSAATAVGTTPGADARTGGGVPAPASRAAAAASSRSASRRAGAPTSYAESVAALQRLGYERIALGGLVAAEDPRDPRRARRDRQDPRARAPDCTCSASPAASRSRRSRASA